MRKYAAEALGTFGLVFAGTSAIVVNDLSGGVVTHVGVSLTFGSLSVMWLYGTAPLLGAGLAVLGCRCVRGADCCSPSLSGGAA